MFVKYVTNNTCTSSSIAQDIGALLCGADISSLSNGCNKLSSTQSGYGSWTMVDTNANGTGNTGVVVSALDADSKTTKYCYLYRTSNAFSCSVSENWNPTTHVGTYSTGSISVTSTGSAGTAFTIYILTSGTEWIYITTTTTSGGVLFGEVSRGLAVLNDHYTLGYQQVQFVATVGTSSVAGSFPRLRNPLTQSTLVTNASCTIGGGINSSAPNSADIYDGNGNPYVQTKPLYATYASTAILMGKIRGNILQGQTTYPSAALGDVLSINGVDYFIHGSFLFPIVA